MTAPFITLCGFPVEGDTVEVTDDAKRWLISQGWTPPEEHYREVLAVHEGYGVESWCPACREHWPCKAIQEADDATDRVQQAMNRRA